MHILYFYDVQFSMSLNKLNTSLDEMPLQDYQGTLLKLTIKEDTLEQAKNDFIQFLSQMDGKDYSLQNRRTILADMVGYKTDILRVKNDENADIAADLEELLSARIEHVRQRVATWSKNEWRHEDITNKIWKPGRYFVNEGFSNAGKDGGLTEINYDSIQEKFQSISIDTLTPWEASIVQREIRRFFYDQFGILVRGNNQSVVKQLKDEVNNFINERYEQEENQDSERKETQEKFHRYLENYWYSGSSVLSQPAIISTEMFAYRTNAFEKFLQELVSTFEKVNTVGNKIIKP